MPVPIAHTGSYAITIFLHDPKYFQYTNPSTKLTNTKRKQNVLPILSLQRIHNRLQLCLDGLGCLVRFALGEGLAYAEDDGEAFV